MDADELQQDLLERTQLSEVLVSVSPELRRAGEPRLQRGQLRLMLEVVWPAGNNLQLQ